MQARPRFFSFFPSFFSSPRAECRERARTRVRLVRGGLRAGSAGIWIFAGVAAFNLPPFLSSAPRQPPVHSGHARRVAPLLASPKARPTLSSLSWRGCTRVPLACTFIYLYTRIGHFQSCPRLTFYATRGETESRKRGEGIGGKRARVTRKALSQEYSTALRIFLRKYVEMAHLRNSKRVDDNLRRWEPRGCSWKIPR